MNPYLNYKDYLKNRDICVIMKDSNLGNLDNILNYASNSDYLKYKNCRIKCWNSGIHISAMSYIPPPVSKYLEKTKS